MIEFHGSCAVCAEYYTHCHSFRCTRYKKIHDCRFNSGSSKKTLTINSNFNIIEKRYYVVTTHQDQHPKNTSYTTRSYHEIQAYEHHHRFLVQLISFHQPLTKAEGKS